MKIIPRDYQIEASDKAVQFLTDDSKEGNGLIVAGTGCHAKGYGILMYDGTIKKVEDVEVGDRVMGNDGTPRTVLCLRRGREKMYEITPIKGEPFVVNASHKLHLYRTRRTPNDHIAYEEIMVKDYVLKGSRYKHLHKLHRAEGIEFGNEQGYVPEPYFLGLFIGDGCSVSGLGITTQRNEVSDFLYAFAQKYGLSVRRTQKENSKAWTLHLVNKYHNGQKENPIKHFLMKYELYESRSGDKFIPYEYKVAKRSDRMELLAGLLDTDAYYEAERKSYEYCTKSKRLAYDVQFLCRSLGLYALIGKTKYVNGTPYYRLQITGRLSEIPTKVGIRRGEDRQQIKNHLVTGFSVKEVGEGDYYGFTLDGNNLYLDWQYFVHHNCGKSVIISEIANKLDSKVLVFCPTKEILQQNYAKMKNYTDDCSMYSASVGKKEVSKITFATIGSVKSHPSLFDEFEYLICDECHLINPEEGMYRNFLDRMQRKMIGLTATPYRLETKGVVWNRKERRMDYSNAKSYLRPIVGKNQVFNEVVYNIDSQSLLDKGYLAKLRYFDVKPPKMESISIFKNTSGAEFSPNSLKWMEDHTDFYNHMMSIIKRVQHPKDGKPRRGILVFVRMIELANYMAQYIDSCKVISGDTPKKERDKILKEFAEGKFQVLLNVAVLVVGYDRPDLDTVIMGVPTMSLSKWYQCVGRCIRPFEGKDGWIIDLGGNIARFGEVHRLTFKQDLFGVWNVYNDKKKLTNIEL